MQKTALERDSRGQVTVVAKADGKKLRTFHDASGRVSSTVDEINRTTTHTYDAAE